MSWTQLVQHLCESPSAGSCAHNVRAGLLLVAVCVCASLHPALAASVLSLVLAGTTDDCGDLVHVLWVWTSAHQFRSGQAGVPSVLPLWLRSI